MTPVTKRPRRAATAGTGTVHDEVVIRTPEYRDWAGLMPELVSKISDHVVFNDLADYIRMRAVCKPWKISTEDPDYFEPRYFPRNWLLLAGEHLRDDGEPERFVNVHTGEVLRIHLPDPHLFTHHGSTEGLLILHNASTDTVCLLNPLTMVCAEFPTMAAVYDVARPCDAYDRDQLLFSDSIKAAGVIMDVDEQGRALSRPTIVLSLSSGNCTRIVCAKLGDTVWTAVEDMNCGCHIIADDHPSIQGGGLAVRGRFYVPTYTGDVLTVELQPWPRLRYVARMTGDFVRRGFHTSSYLVPSLDDTDCGMLVRARGPNGKLGCTRFTVDLGNQSLSMQQPSGVTVFLPSVTLRCSAFPSVKENAVYLKSYMRRLMRGDYIR
ncbi:hypothetical protein QOZ80_5BG0439450 [Eleusine coracana subsp. coracana]|nr:hypothetical protein QOZ80_5BG0439450 [Eleusine coracana subsp. coracana]